MGSSSRGKKGTRALDGVLGTGKTGRKRIRPKWRRSYGRGTKRGNGICREKKGERGGGKKKKKKKEGERGSLYPSERGGLEKKKRRGGNESRCRVSGNQPTKKKGKEEKKWGERKKEGKASAGLGGARREFCRTPAGSLQRRTREKRDESGGKGRRERPTAVALFDPIRSLRKKIKGKRKGPGGGAFLSTSSSPGWGK